MIALSMVLVAVAAAALLAGLLAADDLTLIWISIVSALAAAVFLLLGVLRLRARMPPQDPADDVPQADDARRTDWGPDAEAPEG